MKLARVDQFAAANHGIITRDAAARAGISKASWYRALDSGLLEPVYPNVARVVGSPRTREQAIAAAVLAARPGAMASHRSAAYLLGVPRPETDPIEILFTDRCRGLRLVGVIVHHPRDDRDLNPIRRHNILMSNILRLLCDLGAVDPAGVPAAVGHVVSLHLASPAALLQATHRHSRPGRAGVPALRDALEEWTIDGMPPDSVLEPAMARLLARNKIGPWQFHAKIAGFEVDFWVVDTPVVLECDGWDYHGRTRAQFERDTERNAVLVAAGYIPIHFTYHAIVKRPGAVAKQIQDAIDRWPGE